MKAHTTMLKSNNPNIKIENIIEKESGINNQYELTEDSYTYILPNVKNTTLEDVLKQLQEEVKRNGMQDSIVDFLKSILDSAFGEFNSTSDYLNIIERKIEFDQEEIRKRIQAGGRIVRKRGIDKEKGLEYLVDVENNPHPEDLLEMDGMTLDDVSDQDVYLAYAFNNFNFDKYKIVEFLNSGLFLQSKPFGLIDVIENNNLNPFNKLIIKLEKDSTEYIFNFIYPIYPKNELHEGFLFINKLIKDYSYRYTYRGDSLILEIAEEVYNYDAIKYFLLYDSDDIIKPDDKESEKEPIEKNKSRANEELKEQLDKISTTMKTLQINMIDLVDVINNAIKDD